MRVFRFAPSPNGYLHLGHAFSASLNFEMARACGGRFLLRVEDIDIARSRPEFEAAVAEDLAWLGLAWEQPVRRQSEHFDDYRAALGRLEARGLIYPSFESRGEIARLAAARGPDWPRDPDGVPLYPGHAKTLSAHERAARIAAGEAYALRLDMAAAVTQAGVLGFVETDGAVARDVVADVAAWGDVVLARKDIPASYHLAVVVDDALQGVTDVVRGADLFASTGVHRLLQALLGLSVPTYHHHRLILGEDGQKLSKSNKATALRELRRQGATPHDITAMIAFPPGG